ncbi:Acyl-CoA N-acyltransferase [Phaffia rhodozyma]|uniref:Acyl-CoA N-acyltransferase n=1 Tax=Phaffia rhodozyma TaxID=264483 RepID=A0A0F7SNL2_PHARH|nr:Acyl-CoA N-acyltransferase [Phaffia rhodozyma]
MTRLNTYPHWGLSNGVSLEDYLNKDEVMEREEFSTEGKFIVWILTPRKTADQPDTPILAQCKTYRRASSFILDRNSSLAEGKVPSTLEKKVGYGIATVYTPDAYRGKGYAKRMLRELHYLMAAPESLPPYPASLGPHSPRVPPNLRNVLQDAAFSVLYSDIGPLFYTKCYVGESGSGWVAQPSITWEFPVSAASTTATHPDLQKEKDVQWIYSKEDIIPIQSRVSQAVWTQLERSAQDTKGKDGAEVGFLPDQGVLYMIIVKSQAVDPQPGPDDPRRTYGFQTSDGGVVVWSPVVERGRGVGLGINYTMGKIPYDLIARAAASEQYDWIEIWDDRWLAEQEGMGWPVDGRRIERSSSFSYKREIAGQVVSHL